MEEALGEIDGTTRRLKLGDKKFVILCYKGSNVLSASLFIDVSDGENVWSTKLTADGFAAQQKKLKIASQAGVLSIIKNALERRTCELLGPEEEFRLRFGAATAAASVLLPLTPAASPSAATDFLDRLAGASEQWQQRLTETRSSLTELRQQQAAAGVRGVGDAGAFGGGRRGGAKAKPPRVGMSVINPSSRKRKAAKGVVFEEDD